MVHMMHDIYCISFDMLKKATVAAHANILTFSPYLNLNVRVVPEYYQSPLHQVKQIWGHETLSVWRAVCLIHATNAHGYVQRSAKVCRCLLFLAVPSRVSSVYVSLFCTPKFKSV